MGSSQATYLSPGRNHLKIYKYFHFIGAHARKRGETRPEAISFPSLLLYIPRYRIAREKRITFLGRESERLMCTTASDFFFSRNRMRARSINVLQTSARSRMYESLVSPLYARVRDPSLRNNSNRLLR